MATQRIRAGLIAFRAGSGRGSALDRALQVARELVGRRDPSRSPDDLSLACALSVGWATAPADSERRRVLVEGLTGTTGDGRATAAASAVAAMGSYAAVGAPLLSVMAAGIEEAGEYGRGDLTAAAVGSWRVPDGGVRAEPLPSVAAVMAALRGGGDSPGAAIRAAAALDGASRTIAGLAAAIAAARTGGLDGVEGETDDDELAALAEELSALRA